MTIDTKALFAEVQANRAKLDACARHRFDIGDPPYRFGAKFECSVCGGKILAGEREWRLQE